MAQANTIKFEEAYVSSNSLSTADNVTSQSENVTKPIRFIGYDKTGKMIEDGSNIITLTPAQLAEADRLIEEYKKKNAQDPNLIRFPGCTITLTAGTIDAIILENGKTSGNDYYKIQFYTDQADLDKETRDTISRIGCLLGPIGNHAFFAKFPPESLDTVISLVNSGKVRYLGRIPMETKYRPELLAKALANPNSSIKVAIQLFDDASDSDLATLNQLMRIDWHWTDSVAGEAPAGNIKDIIALNFVRWIEEDLPMGFCINDGTSATTVPQDMQNYLVIINTGAENNKNSVLAINNVKYIQDAIYTGIDNEEYPAVSVSATEQAVQQIENLDYVIAVSPINDSAITPISPVSDENIKVSDNKMLVIIASVVIILILIAIIIFLFRKKYGNTA